MIYIISFLLDVRIMAKKVKRLINQSLNSFLMINCSLVSTAAAVVVIVVVVEVVCIRIVANAAAIPAAANIPSTTPIIVSTLHGEM